MNNKDINENRINEGFRRYVASKVGTSDVKHELSLIPEAYKAALALKNDYDLGIEMVRDGLSTGYIFNLMGFPTKAVKLSRRGRGAIWQPLEELSREDLENKRLLLFDNDIVTGRTMSRAVRELEKYSPAYMDSLLMFPFTMLNVKNYKKWRNTYNLPIQDTFVRPVLNIEETASGIKIKLLDDDGKEIEREISDKSNISIKCNNNAPYGLRKIMNLYPDFSYDWQKDNVQEIFADLERRLRERENGK